MRSVRPTFPMLIGNRHYTPEEVVELDDRQADKLIALGHAVQAVEGADKPAEPASPPEPAKPTEPDPSVAFASEVLGFHGIELPQAPAQSKPSKSKPKD
jgi:hypothetical protein